MVTGERVLRLAFVTFIWHQCCLLDRSTALEQCDSSQNPAPYLGVLIKDRGGLNTLVKDAKSTRESILPHDLPYHIIREEFRDV